MLTRMTDLGAAPDFINNPDFARVRALSGWPALESKLTGAPVTTPTAPAPSAPAPPAPSAPSAPLARGGPLSFSAPALDAFALAHDAVSKRFVLGDRNARRLLVVDEM
jgi:hypothetical protein